MRAELANLNLCAVPFLNRAADNFYRYYILLALSLSQVMQENVILAYYAQIWKLSPRLPKMEFFKKISFF